MADDESREQTGFESVIRAMEAEVANVGAHLSLDGATRQAYASQIRAMADELRQQAQTGRMTWAQAAEQAQSTRNVVLELMRSRSTPVGRALAEQLKREGRTLSELIIRKTRQLHGPHADFARLTPSQQNVVYAEIVRSAGKANPRITSVMRTASRAGRVLIVLSVAISVF